MELDLVFVLHYITFCIRKQSENPLSFSLQLGATKLVFLNKFFQRLMDFSSHFSDATEVAKSASAAAQVCIPPRVKCYSRVYRG